MITQDIFDLIRSADQHFREDKPLARDSYHQAARDRSALLTEVMAHRRVRRRLVRLLNAAGLKACVARQIYAEAMEGEACATRTR